MKGTALVNKFLAEHNTDIRAKLIRILHDDGLNNSEISRVLDIDIQTARYWLNDGFRQKKIRARQVGHDCRKIYGWWEACAQAMEARA